MKLVHPPYFAQALLLAVVGNDEADCVAGDLAEEFQSILLRRGRLHATGWYLSQVARSLAPLIQIRIRSGEFNRSVMATAFAVAGPLLLLDQVWRFVYSQVPLKDGLDRAPMLLAINVFCVVACSMLAGARTHTVRSAALVAMAATISAALAVWVSAAAAPVAYAALVPCAALAAGLGGFAWRKSQ